MSCDRCEECRMKGHKFCIYCGEMLEPYLPRNGCDRCEECSANGDVFCRYCGKRLVKEESPLMKIGFAIGLITSVILSLLMVFEWFVAVWGIPMVIPNLPDYGSTLILVVPAIVNVVSFNGVLSQIYYILLILAVTISLGYLLFKGLGPMLNISKGDNKTIRRTAMFEVPVLFSVLFVWELIFILALEACGVEIKGLPDRDVWVWMYELLEASVWEEVITRLLLIGLPMMLIATFLKKEGKSSWRYLFGGFGLNKTVIVLIFFSAFIFGAGHLNNWGWWKFFTTFAFGLIAGYLFSRYGIYSTIMLHFLTDYMSAESWFFGTDSAIMTALIMILLSFACFPYTYIYLKRGVQALIDIFSDQSNGLR